MRQREDRGWEPTAKRWTAGTRRLREMNCKPQSGLRVYKSSACGGALAEPSSTEFHESGYGRKSGRRAGDRVGVN
jgi:hypothetical protein